MTQDYEMLRRLREDTGTVQMAVFAEALYSRADMGVDSRRQLGAVMPLIAAAYLLGRCDAGEEGLREPHASAGPMAEAVLASAGALDSTPTDVPF